METTFTPARAVPSTVRVLLLSPSRHLLIFGYRYFWLWMLGLPVTAPIGIARTSLSLSLPLLNPFSLSPPPPALIGLSAVIPNVPFYFCAWRAWCHRKGVSIFVPSFPPILTLFVAWNGAGYFNRLIAQEYFQPSAEPILDRIYEASQASRSLKLSVTDTVSESSLSEKEPSSTTKPDPQIDDQILLTPKDVPTLIESLQLEPTTEAELLRAIEQTRLRLKKELQGGQ